MGPKVYSRNGCAPCKKRRKKCDEIRPTCGACVRIGLPCTYNQAPVSNKNAFTVTRRPDDDKSAAQYGGAVTSNSSMGWTRRDPQLLQGLSYQAFRLLICESFVVNACEAGWNHDPSEADRLSALTIRTPLSLASSDDLSASRTAWRAYCYHVFGTEHDLPAMRMQSKSLYSEVVAMLYTLDWDGNSVKTAMEIMSAATFLNMLEARASINPRAWIIHNEGVQAMIIRLGPHAFTDPQRLKWFESCRWTFIFVNIIQNKSTDLENDIWLTVPWLRLGMHGWEQEKPMEQQMLDIMLVGRRKLRGLLALKSAPDSTSFQQIMGEFWLNYGEIRRVANDWRTRHSSRIAVEDWFVHEHASHERKLFPCGVPLFSTPVATVSVSWFHLLLLHVNTVTAFLCVLMAEIGEESDQFELDCVVHWLWIDEPETEQDILAYMHDPALRPRAASGLSTDDRSKVLWLAMADRALELSRYSAEFGCGVILPLVREGSESFTSMLSIITLVSAINALGDHPLGHWAREKCLALISSQTFNEIMETVTSHDLLEL